MFVYLRFDASGIGKPGRIIPPSTEISINSNKGHERQGVVSL
jgi:hypothetical protein